MTAGALTLSPLPAIPLVRPGDDLARLLIAGIDALGAGLESGDVLVVAQKIVSKSEGRLVDLDGVTPSPRAEEYARLTGKDPRLVEIVLGESAAVLRHAPNVMIVEHRRGWIMANAGVDQSNVEPVAGKHHVLLLPEDPDASCLRLKSRLDRHFGVEVGVIVNDSFGRAWRNGTVGVALGSAGLPALRDLRGRPDLFGRKLEITEVGFADEIAAAASLIMGQAAEGRPAILVRGLAWSEPVGRAADLIRSKSIDLFR